MNKNIAKVVVGLPVQGPFDYAVDPAQRKILEEGMRVRVMFNRRKTVGYVVGFRESTLLKRVNTIIGPLENRPSAGPTVVEWTRRAADYYGCSWGEILELVYPNSLRRGKYVELTRPSDRVRTTGKGHARLSTGFRLCPDDDALWQNIVADNIDRGQAVLIIVPDKFYAAYFKERLAAAQRHPVIALDKRVNVEEQIATFNILQAGQPVVILGTRSAVFVPHPNIGHIIIVHEEHDWHKSEQSPHYRTSRIAMLRSEVEGCDTTFLCLNPRVELWHEARTDGWEIEPPHHRKRTPVQLVDLGNYNPGKSSILSFPVQNTIRDTLAAGGRLLLFFNRKGFMTFTRCQQCGHAIKCPRCDTHLVLRHQPGGLSCHGCGFTREVPSRCPECQWPYLRSTGMGIEKLESEVHRYFPEAKTAVLDKDTQALPRNADIVLATSAIFKFQATYRAEKVIVMDYDQALHHADFRSGQRCFTTLCFLQDMAREKLIVQTRLPDDPAIKAARDGEAERFWDSELEVRRDLNLPPFVCAATVIVRGPQEDRVWKAASELHAALVAGDGQAVEAGEPYPDVRPKLRDQYRYNIMVKSSDHAALMKAVRRILKEFRSSRYVIITLDVDP